MANKDLVKRAFSVTANLPSQRKEDPSAASTPLASVTTPPNVPVARVAAPDESRQAPNSAAPKTGPGSMLAFMTEQSEVHREVVQLREKVSAFQGADVAKRLDPKQIVPSKWANRNEAHFQSAAFVRLKDEIASAGGNVQPIKVRTLPAAADGAERWEIVFGHRRHRACLELGIPVLALVQEQMKDADLFVEMERENRERADLSAWEQGVMYVRALELGLFPSAKQMASAIDRDTGNISKSMALAKLPGDVIKAFGSPLNLQFRWATALKDAHQKDPERLLKISRELVAREEKPAPAEVFAILTRGEGGKTAATNDSDVDWKDADGKRIAHLVTDKKGRVTLQFERPLDATERRKLSKFLDAFLERR